MLLPSRRRGSGARAARTTPATGRRTARRARPAAPPPPRPPGAARPSRTGPGLAVDDDGRDAVGARAAPAARQASRTGSPPGRAATVARPSVSTHEQRRDGAGRAAARRPAAARARSSPSASGVRPPVRSAASRACAAGTLDVGGSTSSAAGRPERDQPDLVPALVGVAQQRQHRAGDGGHPPPRGHRAGGVDGEQHEVALAALALGAAQVAAVQQQPGAGAAAGPLVRRGGGDRGGQVQVRGAARACRRSGARSGRCRCGPASGGRARPPRRRAPRAGGPEGGDGGGAGAATVAVRRGPLGRWSRVGRDASGADAVLRLAGQHAPPTGRRRPGRRGPGRRRVRSSGSGPSGGSSGSGCPRSSQRLVEGLARPSRLVERVAAAPVRQREPRGGPHVLLGHRVGAPPCRVRRRRAGDHEVGAHAVDVERRAHRRDPAQLGVGQRTRRQPLARAAAIRPRQLAPRRRRRPRRTRPGRPRTPSGGARPRRAWRRRATPATSTVSPNRSSSCGRSSPSSGFIVPTSRNAPRATPTPRRARRARGPSRRRRAAGRRGGRAAG